MDYSKITNARDANQITRAYFDSILIEPRYLDSDTPDTSFTLWRRTFTSPIMIAAFSHLNNTHPDGMVEMARGAQKAGILNWAGMGSEEEFSRIRETGAHTIKIVKPYKDRKKVISMLKFAEKCGALAVGMDIDHSFDHNGNHDCVLGHDMEPVTQKELASFVKATNLPFVVKGVLSLTDAKKCLNCGVSGLLLSHHHGIMPYAIPPLMLLPRLRKEYGNKVKLFVDCGVDSGADAYKCLALGADAVCVGRVILPSLKEHGADGVAAFVDGMRNELSGIMAKTNARTLKKITPDALWNADTAKPFEI